MSEPQSRGPVPLWPEGDAAPLRPDTGAGPQWPEGDSAPLWPDADAGPLVRLYALTRGRARPASQIFDLISLITAQTRPENEPGLTPEQAALLELCRDGPQSVAELAASCDLPLGVARVILSDLLEFGHIHVRRPLPPNSLLDEQIFQEVINGLRAL